MQPWLLTWLSETAKHPVQKETVNEQCVYESITFSNGIRNHMMPRRAVTCKAAGYNWVQHSSFGDKGQWKVFLWKLTLVTGHYVRKRIKDNGEDYGTVLLPIAMNCSPAFIPYDALEKGLLFCNWTPMATRKFLYCFHKSAPMSQRCVFWAFKMHTEIKCNI